MHAITWTTDHSKLHVAAVRVKAVLSTKSKRAREKAYKVVLRVCCVSVNELGINAQYHLVARVVPMHFGDES